MRPPALFVAAAGPCSLLCLARTGACVAEESWAPLWTSNAAAAKRLLCVLQRQTSPDLPSVPPVFAKVLRQEVDPATGLFALWTQRSATCTCNQNPAGLLITSLWAAYALSKAIAPLAVNRASHMLSFLDVVLTCMQQSPTGGLKLVLSATVLSKILSASDAQGSGPVTRWVACAEEAIAQIAEALQAVMRGYYSFDNWIVVCALSVKPHEQLLSSHTSKIAVASKIEFFLSSLLTVIQELMMVRFVPVKLQTLVTGVCNSITVPFNDLSEMLHKEYQRVVYGIDFPISKIPFLEQQGRLSNSSLGFIALEPLSSWSLLYYDNGDTILIYGLRSRSIGMDTLDNYLHLTGVQNNSGETALMVAIKTGQYDLLPTLIPLEAGFTDYYGNTAITLILSSEDDNLLQYVTAILRYESEALRRLNFTDLMLEVLSEPCMEPARLDQVRQQTVHGHTALMLAVLMDHLSAVQTLAPLEAGMRNKKLKQAGTIAFEMDRRMCIELLVPYEDIRDAQSNTALHRAVMETQGGAVASELSKYYQMARKYNASGYTALMEAARRGNTEAVTALVNLEGGMTTPKTIPITLLYSGTSGRDCQTITEATAFMVCLIQLSSCNSEHETILHTLSEREGDIACSNGITPLMLLGILNKPIFYPFCRTTLGRVDNKGKTSLMYAAEHAAWGLIPLLLEHEGGLQDISGWTALLYAVRDNSIIDIGAITELAQREGNLINRWGWSALMYAVHNNNADLIRLLLPFSTQEQIVQAQRHAYGIKRSDSSKEHLSGLFAVLDIV
ncbi:Protein 21.1 [Giardia lamblia P15]|uniref:Protein 21.1 n=1 Tax=Giardia intestinalis (strain P15) TaxID=658858 RepID=E1F4C8_GIAIA|nr:Protein 21.1 [Giardia lamblia P15]